MQAKGDPLLIAVASLKLARAGLAGLGGLE